MLMEQTYIDELRMRFQVIAAVLMTIKVLWGFMSCRLVNIYWHFEGMFYPLLQIQAVYPCEAARP